MFDDLKFLKRLENMAPLQKISLNSKVKLFVNTLFSNGKSKIKLKWHVTLSRMNTISFLK